MTEQFDVVIIGAGAAGMMCAIEAGRRGRKTLVMDHAKKPGEKIRISGGGRCNFTNLHAAPENFISANRHFAKSALKRFTQFDFIDRVNAAGILWHEKTLGQLFCDGSAQQIIDMLVGDMKDAGVALRLQTSVTSVSRRENGFSLETTSGMLRTSALVIASGGKSIPKMGATGFGYDVAKQFDLNVLETRPGLVPLTFDQKFKDELSELSGLAMDVRVQCGKTSFSEAMLFTHRGLSGPAILQISSYWREGQELGICMVAEGQAMQACSLAKQKQGRQSVQTVIAGLLPARLARKACERAGVVGNIADLSDKKLARLAETLSNWRVKPAGSEGYRTAEVTLGGVDTGELSSNTMEAKTVPGLYFIGEVVDVTGWLGGYNFQWAWSSGWAAGQVV